MNHLDLAAHESASLEPTAWDAWIAEATRIAGHDLDGDQDEDGYSLDGAHDDYEAGFSPAEHVAGLRVTRHIDHATATGMHD